MRLGFCLLINAQSVIVSLAKPMAFLYRPLVPIQEGFLLAKKNRPTMLGWSVKAAILQLLGQNDAYL